MIIAGKIYLNDSILYRMARVPRVTRVYLFHWKEADAPALIAHLRKAGFAVAWRKAPPKVSELLAISPLAVVIDLSKLPSQGGSIAAWIRGTKSLRHLPIVFVNGEPAKVETIQKRVPDAVYTNTKNLGAAILNAIKTQPAHPVVPPQMMQSTRSTAEKLGIRTGDRVSVIDPPRNYRNALGTLPQNTELVEDSTESCAVTLWFIHDAAEYRAALPKRRTLAAKSKLWILWSKGHKDGFNGNLVRDSALRFGLVDYKICSINETWSGIAVAVKKAK